MEKLYIKTVFKDLLEGLDGIYTSISLFNFRSGMKKFNLDDPIKDTVVSQGTTWIRVHIKGGQYYDFITSGATVFIMNGNYFVMCSDNTEFINLNYIAQLIKEFKLTEEDLKNASPEESFDKYFKNISKEVDKITEEMEQLYTIAKQISTSRLDVQETYDFGKQKLERYKMLSILIKQVSIENKDEIMTLI